MIFVKSLRGDHNAKAWWFTEMDLPGHTDDHFWFQVFLAFFFKGFTVCEMFSKVEQSQKWTLGLFCDGVHDLLYARDPLHLSLLL